MGGGKLHQHIESHGIGGQHGATIADCVAMTHLPVSPPPITITSTHHQAAVGDAQEANFIDLMTGSNKDVVAVEAWVSVDHDIAAVQYHPEYMDPESDGMLFFQDLMRYLLSTDPKRYTNTL